MAGLLDIHYFSKHIYGFVFLYVTKMKHLVTEIGNTGENADVELMSESECRSATTVRWGRRCCNIARAPG